jgi:hypothetical protein
VGLGGQRVQAPAEDQAPATSPETVVAS